MDGATINLVADGFVTAYASASSTNAGSSFCYGVDAGAELYATVQAPKAFGWDLSVPKYQIAQAPPIQIVPRTCPIGARDLEPRELFLLDAEPALTGPSWATMDLVKRSPPVGPLLRLSDLGLSISCPGSQSSSNTTYKCPLCGGDESDPPQRRSLQRRAPDACENFPGRPGEPRCGGDTLMRRSLDTEYDVLGVGVTEVNKTHYAILEKRTNKVLTWSTPIGNFDLDFGDYPYCSQAISSGRVTKYYTFEDSNVVCSGEILKLNKNQVPNSVSFQNDHVYEAQTLIKFFDFLIGRGPIALPNGYTAASADWLANYVMGVDPNNHYTVNGHTLFEELSTNYGGFGGQGLANMAILDSNVNGVKGTFFGLGNPSSNIEPTQTRTKLKYRNVSIRVLFVFILLVSTPLTS